MKIKEINFDELGRQVEHVLAAARTQSDLELIRRDWISKGGIIRELFRQLREVPPEDKPQIAAALNTLKEKLEKFVASREAEFAQSKRTEDLGSTFFDLSLPGRSAGLGRIHPITATERRIAALLRPFGFVNIRGPEIESEYYCFDALNIPKHHPARDMQDTFYTGSGHVLRTHTTSVQARELEKGGLPVKVASFGRVYRNETEDASHQAMFHQFELVWIEQGLTLSNLQALIAHLLKGLYGKRRRIRFTPRYYPYTEPSIGPQIDCTLCKGKGCSACGDAGWVTVAGAGMVHRKVLEEFKYDPEEVSGFAFGLGTSRLAAQSCGIPTLKMVYENDLRILKKLR